MAQHTHTTANPFGSEGIGITLTEDNGRITGASLCQGTANPLNLFHPSIDAACEIFNRPNRIATPMLRRNGQLQPISMEQAVDVIAEAVHRVRSEQNAMLVSPHHTNELMYAYQKIARCGMDTSAVGALRYADAHPILNIDKNDIVPLHELLEAKHIYLLDADLEHHHPIMYQLIERIKREHNTPVTLISNRPQPADLSLADSLMAVRDPRALFRALNRHLLQSDQASGIFIGGVAKGFEPYRQQLLALEPSQLLHEAGLSEDQLYTFARVFMGISKTVVVLSEHNCPAATLAEVRNLMLLTERQAKPSTGLIYLKSTCNSQGVFDMGLLPTHGPGGIDLTQAENRQRLQSAWGHEIHIPSPTPLLETLNGGQLQNIFVMGENPMLDMPEIGKHLMHSSFICVQSLFENETTAMAHLVLPMNFGIEVGGSYTSSFRTVQSFGVARPAPIDWNDYRFAHLLGKALGVDCPQRPIDVFLEMAELLPTGCKGPGRHWFTWID